MRPGTGTATVITTPADQTGPPAGPLRVASCLATLPGQTTAEPRPAAIANLRRQMNTPRRRAGPTAGDPGEHGPGPAGRQPDGFRSSLPDDVPYTGQFEAPPDLRQGGSYGGRAGGSRGQAPGYPDSAGRGARDGHSYSDQRDPRALGQSLGNRRPGEPPGADSRYASPRGRGRQAGD